MNPNEREDFAPFWLAMSILDDKPSCEQIEAFMRTTYSHGGALYIHNKRTGTMYDDAADRYASTVVFLASLWSRSDQYSMSSDRGRHIVDTGLLLGMRPPECFNEALRLGELAYREKQSKAINYGHTEYSDGHWEWREVWVSDYPDS